MREAVSPTSNPCIFILGMHRSGTSAVARVLAASGAFAGTDDELLPPHPQDNPAGYWDRTVLVVDNKSFLNAQGPAGDRAAVFEASAVGAADTATLQANLRRTIRTL